MNITINRKTTNKLYTMGEMRVNGSFHTSTLEATDILLPAGTYSVHIIKISERKQSLCIFPTGITSFALEESVYTINIGHSWKDSQRQHSLLIGMPIIPGALFKAGKLFSRLTDRINKAVMREEAVELTITDSGVKHTNPSRFWLNSKLHGCPPTRQTVDVTEDGDIIVHYADGRMKRMKNKSVSPPTHTQKYHVP